MTGIQHELEGIEVSLALKLPVSSAEISVETNGEVYQKGPHVHTNGKEYRKDPCTSSCYPHP